MYYKTSSRLFVIKFLGLFGSLQHLPNSGDKHKLPDEDLVKSVDSQPKLKGAIDSSSRHVTRLMLERGIPGLTICVSKKGRIVWSGAFGLCDVENLLECKSDARMRVASISKSLFVSTIIAPMIEQNKLDIKASIHKYLTVAEFPRQKFEGKESDITVEQLLSHTSGIKHYEEGEDDEPLRPIGSSGSIRIHQCSDQYNRQGFYQRQTFRSVIDALEPFKNEPLASEPGKYSYTTYGYTLLSAVAEKIHQQTANDDKIKKEQIEDYWVKVLHREWDLNETNLDQDEPILSNRARYYVRLARKGGLVNAPYTDNSNKWAGGGINSSAKDLVKFGIAMVDSYKGRESAKLKRDTVELLWTKKQGPYCLGFETKQLEPSESAGEQRAVYHLGCALGASSALIIYPESEVVVAILANLGSANLRQLALEVANRFAQNF